MIFKRKYHVAYYKIKNGLGSMCSIELKVKRKFDVNEAYDYLKEFNDCEEIIIINWIKL